MDEDGLLAWLQQVLGGSFAFDAQVQAWGPTPWPDWNGGDACIATE